MTTNRLDRSTWLATARRARIVHVGVGAFSRAHQAWYTAQVDPGGEWGIAAFTGRRPDVANVLNQQDGLYTLIERGPDADRLEVIDSIVSASPGADLAGLVTAIAAAPTAVVTLTVSEAGYALAAGGGPVPSVPMRLALGLAARYRAGEGPVAIVSCDNLQANGRVLRELTVAAADEIDPQVGEWVETEVSFVSTSVDRITPPAGEQERALVARELDRLDDAVVVCEPFSDWVLCGDFPAGRPAWEDRGARFVADITPWETRKLWLLNGGHTLLAYMGLLSGYRTVAQAARDPQLEADLDRYWDLAQRHLPGADLDLPRYRSDLKERFANARIGYPLTQIASDGLAKLRHRVVPVVEAAMAVGEEADPALHILAAWVEWMGRVPDPGMVDASAGELRPILASTAGRDRTRALISLLSPGWGSREDLVDAISGRQAELAQTIAANHKPTSEVQST
jgi:fructuronate reductase